MKPLAQIKFEDHGIFVRHNMPCGVCCKEAAVYDMGNGTFLPCWKCQKKGWALAPPKPDGWLTRFIRWATK
jgi:hypothetical protein